MEKITMAVCNICGIALGDHVKACTFETPEELVSRIAYAQKVAKIIGSGFAAALRKANEDSDKRIAEMEAKNESDIEQALRWAPVEFRGKE